MSLDQTLELTLLIASDDPIRFQAPGTRDATGSSGMDECSELL